MATQTDPSRPSPAPLLASQRQRLEALQFAKRLVGKGGPYNNPEVDVDDLLRVADYIATGAF
jgi:hypothetical protein